MEKEKEGYVSIQAVNDMLEYCRNFDGNDAIYIFEKWFREQEPVQPKRGRWMYKKEEDTYRCSLCSFPCHKDNMGAIPTKYCAECGAIMQEVEE